MVIPTVEEATEKLQGILRQVTPGLTPAQRSRISDELVSFANPASSYHVPAEPAYAELREVALAASDELDGVLSADAVARLRARSDSLIWYMAAVKTVTEQAEQRAKALHLTLVREVVDSSKTITDAVMEAKRAFEEDRIEAGYAAIAKVINEVEGLRAKLPA